MNSSITADECVRSPNKENNMNSDKESKTEKSLSNQIQKDVLYEISHNRRETFSWSQRMANPRCHPGCRSPWPENARKVSLDQIKTRKNSA